MTSSKPRWAFIHPFQLRLQRGIESYLWNLTSSLSSSGLEIDILTWQGPVEVPDCFQHSGVRILTVPEVRYFQGPIGVPFYYYHLLRENYDHVLIDFAGYGEGTALSLASILKPIPYSIVFHYPYSLVPHRYREFERWGMQKKAQNLIAVSRFVAGQVEQWSGRPCAVIEHGVDAKRFSPDPARRAEIRKRLNIPEDASVLISAAALEERKGMQFVITALPAVLQQFPDTYYIVLGVGAFRASLESIIAGLHLESRVFLLGSVGDVAPYLCAADLFFLLSKGEASSVALLEAMANGLPVITSRHPPFDELIRAEWGIMLDEQNHEVLASTIQYLFQQPGLTRSMGLAARARAMQNYNWDVVVGEYRKLIA